MTTMALAIVSSLAILAVIPALSVVYREFLDRTGLRASILLSLEISAGSLLVWLLASLLVPGVASSPLEFPTAALAAVGGFLASLTVRDTTSRVLPALLFSLGWSALVFVPVALVVLFPTAVSLGAGAGPLDLGGALPVHVAVGGGALVVLTFARNWAVEDRSHVRPRSWSLWIAGVVIWAGWTIGYVGLEVGLDSVVTPRIITNAIVAPLLGVIGWLVGQRIRTATTTPIGAVAGLLSGIVAIAPGCAYFTPLWAGLTGAVAGLAGSIFVSGWVRRTGRHAWFIVGAHLLAGIIGLLMIGIFGTGFGFIYDGQTTLVVTQFLSIIAVVVWSTGISLVLWLLVRRAAVSSRRRRLQRGVA
jgi:Amt family ammonium transporter